MSKPIELLEEVKPITVVRTTDAGYLIELLNGSPMAVLNFEGAVYHFASVLTEGQYKGGSWKLVHLSNGGFFMVYQGQELFDMHNYGNQTVNQASGMLFSVIVNYYVSSHLSFKYFDEGREELARIIADNYHLLRDFVYHDHSPFDEHQRETFYKVTD